MTKFWFVRYALSFFKTLGYWAFFTFDVLKSFIFRRSLFYAVCLQGYEIGVTSLPVVILTGSVTGIVLALQAYYQLGVYGFSCAIGFFVVKSILVEIGPVLTALVLSGRVGGAISAFLGSLCMSDQIEAMKILGVNPLRYFALPRIIAGVITMPALVMISVWFGILSGFLLCYYAFHLSAYTYWSMVMQNILPSDLILAVTKSIIFGFIITAVSCFQGLRVNGRDIKSITLVTTSGVVASYISILFVNCLITTLFHIL